MEKIKFPEWGLPGLEIVNGPCGSLLHTWTASQRPYGAKICFFVILIEFPDFPDFSLLRL